jgi:hypothetical protein
MTRTTLNEMIEDLQGLVAKYGDLSVEIYCSNCDCGDGYHGATGGSEILITINKEGEN